VRATGRVPEAHREGPRTGAALPAGVRQPALGRRHHLHPARPQGQVGGIRLRGLADDCMSVCLYIWMHLLTPTSTQVSLRCSKKALPAAGNRHAVAHAASSSDQQAYIQNTSTAVCCVMVARAECADGSWAAARGRQPAQRPLTAALHSAWQQLAGTHRQSRAGTSCTMACASTTARWWRRP